MNCMSVKEGNLGSLQIFLLVTGHLVLQHVKCEITFIWTNVPHYASSVSKFKYKWNEDNKVRYFFLSLFSLVP